MGGGYEESPQLPDGGLEEEIERETLQIHYDNCCKGLGIKIVGGCSLDGEEDYGIFVKRVLPGGLAEIEGRLQNGDQILEVNGDSLEGVTNDRAVAILRKASATNVVDLLVSRDDQAREEYEEVLERQTFLSHNCTPVHTETPSRESSKASSRCTTPSVTDFKAGVSPRYDHSVYHTPQQNGVAENQNGVSEISHPDQDYVSQAPAAPGETTPSASWYPHPAINPTDRFGARIQPNMASTPQAVGGRVRLLPSYNTSLSMIGHGDNISPVLAPGTQGPPLHTMGMSQTFSGTEQLPRSQDMSQTRKLSLDPHVRLKVEKLEDALRYLGLEPSPEQQAVLRTNLGVDNTGTVSYGDFVREAREIFRLQLDEKNIGPGAMLFAAQDLTSLLEPPPFKPELSTIPDVAFGEDFDTVRQERDELRKEVQRLKMMLKEKEETCNVAEDEILRIRRQAQGAIHETRSLRSKVHLAEQAQRAARNMEQDYEEVVKLLEKEIAEMKEELDKRKEVSTVDMEKRLAVISCQLRKTDSAKKTYEVATQKLLQFVEHVHETMKDDDTAAQKRVESFSGEATRGRQSAVSIRKQQGQKRLASDAREVVRAVKSLTDSQDLPYGWEEAYTEDGMRYYINHLTQMTTWSHPVSNIHHLPTIQGSEVKGQKGKSLPRPGPSS
ncbi:syntaxin-binding protein 4-like [Liolophura sinensis]|uniref:syntaxin-binding protein 4-like n=1 Tax=Liolophura sinensis TaxID=3198878 RepID=UPI003158EBD9